jgi:hypothetical protein
MSFSKKAKFIEKDTRSANTKTKAYEVQDNLI